MKNIENLIDILFDENLDHITIMYKGRNLRFKNKIKPSTIEYIKNYLGDSYILTEYPSGYNLGIRRSSYAELPRIILPIGCSGSGKSTKIKAIQKESNNRYIVISPDEIRKELTNSISDKSKDEEVYKLAYRRVTDVILSGRDVIFDSTNLKKSRREELYSLGNFDFSYILMDNVEPKILRERIIKDLVNGIDRADVPLETLERHFKSYDIAIQDLKNENIRKY